MSKSISGILLLLLLTLTTIQFNSSCQEVQDYSTERRLMVKNQIQDRGVVNQKVLAAMMKVERHRFVPENLVIYAYNDHPLPIGEDQTISQPYIVGLMTETLDPDSSDRILEIGTGSGYQTAILAELCKEVYSIEIKEKLGENAKKLLFSLGYKNINVKIGDGYYGWKEFAPFDGIIVTCSPTDIPVPLKEQLAEGGRMIIPYGKPYNQMLVILTKKKGKLIEDDVIPVRFVPMINENGKIY